jgi:hypothetical protein
MTVLNLVSIMVCAGTFGFVSSSAMRRGRLLTDSFSYVAALALALSIWACFL